MSSALLVCPSCRVPLKLAVGTPASKVRCPRCGNVFLPEAPPAPPVQHDTCSANPDLATVGLEGWSSPGADSFLCPPQQAEELGRLGSYRVLKVLGQGGMGRVYQAEDTLLQRQVALKVLLPNYAGDSQARQRFLREARAAAALEHDNVVVIHQVGEDNGVPFLAMPLLRGESLADCLQREGMLPVPEVLRVGREIAEGVQAAHEHDLIHRDIKPGNIWLEGGRRRVKILDFGLARAGAVSAENQLTRPGVLVGTPSYMSPEQAAGHVVDGRSDLFSLGCVLYQMCTGELPFRGDSLISILAALATHTPEAPAVRNPAVPRALSDLVMRLLAKERDDRPATAQAVVEELATIDRDMDTPRQHPQGEKNGLRPSPGRTVSSTKASETVVSFESGHTPKRRLIPGRRRRAMLAGIGLLILLPPGLWLASVVLRVETAMGTLLVEMNDEATEARIKDGKLVLTGPDDKVRYTLNPSERNKELAVGEYKVHVEGADGVAVDTAEFALKKNGKITVRVTAVPKTVTEESDPDRRAAAWVLSIGGRVGVNAERWVSKDGVLPREPFRLTHIDLEDCKQANDANLAHCSGCKNLSSLNLKGTEVSEAGLAHFKGLNCLTDLNLECTKVNDTGLAYFKGCNNLTTLYLYGTQVSDASLLYFKDCRNLRALNLGSTRVSDRGLAYFKDCKDLDFLCVQDTKVSDAGLAHLKGCPNLRELNLGLTKVTDTGLAHFADCKSLTTLHLFETEVTDAGLANFKNCKSLTNLDLHGTKVTDSGIACLKDNQSLKYLNLNSTMVSDKGLSCFKNNGELTALLLNGTKVSDEGVTQIRDCKHLTELILNNTNVGDAGLRHFKQCVGLTILGINGTKVSDLSPLKGMKLTVLWCHETRVTDLSPLKGMPLKELRCDFKPERDAAILRSIPTLERINEKPAADFWKEVQTNNP